MFHLIPDDEYNEGLKQLETDVLSGNLICRHSGETLVMVQKEIMIIYWLNSSYRF